MKYFSIEKKKNEYSICFTDEFYKNSKHYYHQSYWNLIYHLFDMLPQDFYHYIGAQYHATFTPSKYIRWVLVSFKEKSDAEAFAKDCDQRFDYFIQEVNKNVNNSSK